MLRIAFWARWLLLPVGLVLALWLLVDLTSAREVRSAEIPWAHVVAAFGLNVAYVLVYALMWHAVTLANGVQVAIPAGIATYLYANAGKYVPFKVAGMALRIAIYSQRFGRDPVMTTKAVYVETLAALVGGVLVGACLFPWVAVHYRQVAADWWVYVIIGTAIVVLLLPATQRTALEWMFKRLGRSAPGMEEGLGSYLRLIAGYALAWILLGTSLLVLCLGFGAAPTSSTAVMAIEAYVIAGVAGMVSVFVPSGIGVREGIMVLGLSPMLGLEQAIIVAILARVVISAAELIGIVAGFVYLEKWALTGD